jgi:hypothetical protein
LLHLVGRRLSVPDDDPMIASIIEATREPAPEICEFLAPSVWRRGLCNPGPLIVRRVGGRPGARVLFDGSGRLALGLWRGRPAGAQRAFVGDARLRKRAAMPSVADIDILLHSWLVAARRWCRRFAHLGLSDLVCREGHVTVTRTHVDVLFDHRQAEARVRKAGLDLNPGWVAWFGRVVTFHYLDREQLNDY